MRLDKGCVHVLNEKFDIVLEIIEVFINQILYARALYPEHIFKTQKVYNWPVKASVFPSLNNYIYRVMKAAKDLGCANKLDGIEMVLYDGENEIVESYNFAIKRSKSETRTDGFYADLEEKVRFNFAKLSERLNFMPKLKKNVKYKLLLHTDESAFLQMSRKRQHQSFPWLQSSDLTKELQKSTHILPLINLNVLSLQIFAEIF